LKTNLKQTNIFEGPIKYFRDAGVFLGTYGNRKHQNFQGELEHVYH